MKFDLVPRVKRQRALANFGDLALRSENLDHVLTEACWLVRDALGTDRSKILELQPEAGDLLFRAGVGWAPELIGRLRLRLADRISENVSLRTGEPVITCDVAKETRFQIPSFVREAGVLAFVTVPIFVPGGRAFGILQVDSDRPRQFDEDDVEFLRTYAAILGPVIDRLQLAGERRKIDEQRQSDLGAMEALQRISTELVGGHQPEPLYQRIVEAASKLMGSDAASIQALDVSTGRLKLLAWKGFHPESAAFWEWVGARTGSSCGLAVQSGERIVVADIEQFGSNSRDVEAYRRSNIRSAQSTPLRAFTGQIVGMLSTHWHDGRDPAGGDYRFFDMLARLSADLIERVHASEQIKERDERLRQFGEASQDVLWTRDAQTFQWEYLTPAFETIYGLDRATALSGDNMAGWLKLIVPEDRTQALESLRRVAAGEWVTFEYRIRRPSDGQIRWMRDTDFPIEGKDGQVARIGGVGHDITALKAVEAELRRSEERLRLAQEVAHVGMWDWDIVADTVTWSAEHFSLQGYDVDAVTPSYEAWASGIHPDDRAKAEHALVSAREHREPFQCEYRSLHPDGKIVWLAGVGSYFYDAQGDAVRMVGVIQDVTEGRQWQEHQQVLVAELQHRTRNLLAVVRSMADKTGRASSDLPDFRERFRDRLNALARVQGLLSRLGEHDRVTFDELIQAELAAMDATDKQVTLQGPAGIRLRSSTVQTLALALHELATNAVKYGALGQAGAHLGIDWSVETNECGTQPWLHIDWRETGVKMLPADAAPRGGGQGRDLIERALPYQLGAKTSYAFGRDGVRCTISLPVSASSVCFEPA
jgi:PAS domain S-box-containing protein